MTDPETGESTNKLVPTVNGQYLLDGEYVDAPNLDNSGAPTTLVAIRNDDYTLQGDKADNIGLENNLMEVYYKGMITSENWTDYPSLGSTVRCSSFDCSDNNQIYNSNSYYYDAQIQAGQEPSPINEDTYLPGYSDYVPYLGPTPDIDSAESAMMGR